MVKCLVVDDVEVTRFISESILEQLKIDSVIVSNIEDSKNAVDSNRFDVVLLDWHLGKQTSKNLLGELREKYGKSFPIIVFSGVAGHDKSAEIINAGASAFLLKPTTKEKLETCLKNVGVI